jgi:hypothetical protein
MVRASGTWRSSPVSRNSWRICGRAQAAAVRGGALGRADQRGEPGQVDEADLVQVDHQRAAAGCRLEKGFAQPGHGGGVNLPAGVTIV